MDDTQLSKIVGALDRVTAKVVSNSVFTSGYSYNVKSYGLIGDGVTDDRVALNTLLNTTAPTGSIIYFPPGVYLIGSNIAITDKQFFFVSDFATIKITGNYSALTFNSLNNVTLLASKNSFVNFRFLGTAAGASQNALNFSTDASEFTVDNCTFQSIGGAGIITYVTNSAAGAGGLITHCKFFSCGIGIDGQLVGEYVQVNDNYFLTCTQAIQSVAGNWIVANNNINRCTAGIKWSAGANDGHGIITGNNINHIGNFALDISGLNLGMTITDNHIYSANVSITTSTGIVITGGTLDVSVFTLTTNVGLVFNNVVFVGTTGTVNLTGTSPVYNNCKDLNGQLRFGPQTASVLTGQIRVPNFALNSSSTLQTFAASTSYYISPLYSTVGSRSIVNQIPYSIGTKCKLIGYSINTSSNSSPTQENSTVYLRLNNTTDVTLNSSVQFNALAFTTNSYADMTLNQDIAATDKWEIKFSGGAFVTAPTNGFIAVTLYFSQEF